MLLLLFVGFPVLEVSVFISVGSLIGLWLTLATIIATAIIGAFLLKKQGLAALYNAQENIKSGRLPVEELFAGLFLIVSALLLITPGFVTDGVGFLLFLPQFRVLLKRFISNVLVARTTARVYPNTDHTKPTKPNNPIIDGEFEELYQQENTKKQTHKNKIIEGK